MAQFSLCACVASSAFSDAPFQRSHGGCKCRSYTAHLSARADNGCRPQLVIANPSSRVKPGWSARRDQCTMWGLQMCSLRWSSPFGRVRLGTTPLAPAEAFAASSSCPLRSCSIISISTECCSLAESAVARGCRPFAATLEPLSATYHKLSHSTPAQSSTWRACAASWTSRGWLWPTRRRRRCAAARRWRSAPRSSGGGRRPSCRGRWPRCSRRTRKRWTA